MKFISRSGRRHLLIAPESGRPDSLSTQADAEIDELIAQFDRMWDGSQQLPQEKAVVWQPEGLDGSEWEAARRKAQLALDML